MPQSNFQVRRHFRKLQGFLKRELPASAECVQPSPAHPFFIPLRVAQISRSRPGNKWNSFVQWPMTPLRVEWPQILEITVHFDSDREGMDAEPSAEKITALGEKGSNPLVFFFLSRHNKYLHNQKAFVHRRWKKSSGVWVYRINN